MTAIDVASALVVMFGGFCIGVVYGMRLGERVGAFKRALAGAGGRVYGPRADRGQYDAIASSAREQAEAKGVLLMVLEGKHGTGVASQGIGQDAARLIADLLQKVTSELRELP